MSSPHPRAPRAARAAALALLLAAVPVHAQWPSVVARTGPDDDTWLLAVLDEADLDTRLEILSSLPLRAEPRIGRYLARCLAPATLAADGELELRVLLASAFPDSLSPQLLRQRVEDCLPELEEAMRRLERWRDPQIAAALVRLLPLPHPASSGRAALCALADALAGELASGDGRLDPSRTALLLDVLAALERLADADLLPQALAVVRLSRDSAVVWRARATARALADLAPAW